MDTLWFHSPDGSGASAFGGDDTLLNELPFALTNESDVRFSIGRSFTELTKTRSVISDNELNQILHQITQIIPKKKQTNLN